MSARTKSVTGRTPWYAWPLAPFAFCAGLVVMIPLGIVGLFSIPYFFVFPERHRQVWDFEGTAHQRKLLERWRAEYAKLRFTQRLARAFKKRRLRRKC
jgi:hypothetical protein